MKIKRTKAKIGNNRNEQAKGRQWNESQNGKMETIEIIMIKGDKRKKV